ncbi:sugar MFS transporter [Leeuwenhoekiella palythoae]|uniref:Glucose/galactose transporter n=1 Tax=Leeuwenhoekiella palythoae TaxID=573501 RepID=A0A1M5SCM4_9FLAO|nr:sugar MFS transporter [Leeuwenhoekiella palythoae]RXG29000.1 glucose/galactose transporter [Leeuwenhoekiella palythoae]SHH36225.1 glucose/galactose transporter [Leeuwenhoekiella palythoae]
MADTAIQIKEPQDSKNVSIAIIAGMFFILGFVTWINGALIPFMKAINELTDQQSYLVASASYISFVVMALPASAILKRIGYCKGMSLGLFIMGLGALVFVPAAEARTYSYFLIGIFIQGAGMTLLQTAVNPYITILGPIKSAAKRIAIMGISNKVAGALGSLIFGALLLSGIEATQDKIKLAETSNKNVLLDQMADSVVWPYIIMAICLFIFALLIRKAPLPELEATESDESGAEDSKKTVLHYPHLLFGVLALFVYVGVEVIAGDSIISYGLAQGFPAEQSKFFTSYTLLAMVCSYALGIFLIPKYIEQRNALIISATLGIVLSVLIINTTGFTSVLLIAALGIANAMVWPAIWPLSLSNLGKHTKTGSALLVMGISGGALIPPLYGRLVDVNKADLMQEGTTAAVAAGEAANSGYILLIPCYLIILLFAIWGCRIKSWSK